jgi:AraC-like DNA-binding protein
MTPLAARRLLGEDLIHLPRSAAPLAEFAPNLFDELQVLCDEQVTWEARFNAVEHVLYRRLIEVRGDDRRLSEAISLLSKAPATLSIGGLAEHLQISRKHLNHIFRQAIGVSPKTYARLTRFTAVMTALASPSSKSANLSWLAHEFGFADQSHMCREFISLAEMTPNKLRLLVESTSSNESASSDHRCGQPTGALDAGTTGQPALAVWARLRFAQGAHERS